MNRRFRLNRRQWLAALFFFALILRLGAVAFLHSPDITTSESGRIAANLVGGKGYTFDFYGYRQLHPLRSFMPPLYTAVLAAAMKGVPANPALALNIFQALLSSLSVVLIYAIGELVFDPFVGILAALATATYPVMLVVVTQPTITATNIFMLCLLLWALLRMADDPTRTRIAVAGIVWGANALNRPVILGFLPALALWCFFVRHRLRQPWYGVAGGVFAVALLTVAPWTARNFAIHHQVVAISTNGGFTFWNGNNPFTTGSGFDVYTARAEAFVGHPHRPAGEPDPPIVVWEPYPLPHSIAAQEETLDEVALDRAFYAAGLTFIREHPAQWFRLEVSKFVSFWWFRSNIGTYRNFYRASWVRPYQIVYSLLLALFLLGIYRRRRNWRSLSLFYLLFVFLSLIYCLFNVITRYRWEIEPLMILFAAAAVAPAARAFRPWSPRR